MNSNVNTKWKFFVALVIGFPTEKFLENGYSLLESQQQPLWEMQYENFN